MLTRRARRAFLYDFKTERRRNAISYRDIPHNEAIGPFSVRAITPRYCPMRNMVRPLVSMRRAPGP